MAWLVTNMWIALAAVSVLGLMLGWSFRGAMLLGRTRRAQVERDVLSTELEQAQAEIEGLYKAQRNGVTAASGAGDEALRGELEARERKLGELSSELAKSKAALEQLMSSGARTGGGAAAVTGAAVGAAVAAGASRLDANLDEEEASLVWRNRHLESRVRHLEGQIQEAAAVSTQAPVAEAAMAASSVAATNADEGADKSLSDLQNWQLDYLRTRTKVLERELASAPVLAAMAVAPVAEADESEELANLRWRNRNLERKLAYFESGNDAESGVDEIADDIAEANSSILSDVAPSELDSVEPEENAETDEEPDETAAAVAAVGAAVAAGMGSNLGDALSGLDENIEKQLEDLEPAEDFVVESDVFISADTGDSEEEVIESDPVDAGESENMIVADQDDVASYTESETDADADTDFNMQRERPLALDAPVAGAADDLTVIGGVGPKIEEVLNTLGIYHYDQIAAWTPGNIAWVDDELSFSGRIARERWVEQAQVLVGED